jgi:hypothetical protein
MRSTRRVRTHCDAIHAATRFTRSILNQSTARDDAPNVNKLNFFEGDSGDRVALVPFCAFAAGLLLDPRG